MLALGGLEVCSGAKAGRNNSIYFKYYGTYSYYSSCKSTIYINGLPDIDGGYLKGSRCTEAVRSSCWFGMDRTILVLDYAGVNHTLLTYDTNTTNIPI